MKDFYDRLDISTGIWWVFLIFIFLIYPILTLYGGSLKVSGEPIEPSWWMYILAVFVWDWFVIILLTALSLIGLILTKIHNYITKEN